MDPLINLVLNYRYLIILPLAIVEGPVIMTLSGFLLRLGYFDFWPLYLTLMAGDLIADIGWYFLGYYGARPLVLKHGKFLNITPELINKTELLFKKHQGKILFLSKITMGFGFALVVLITAGISKVSFRKYITLNFLGQFIWTGFLIGIGYLFGNVYVLVDEKLKLFSIVCFITLIVLALYGLSNYFKKLDLQNKL